MKVLLVCRGNVYRSRLAEAYFKSLNLHGFEVRSAGTVAGKNFLGPISPYAQTVIDEYKLGRFTKPKWTQLSQLTLEWADLVICMNRQVYIEGEELGYRWPLKTIIWDIPDVDNLLAQGEAGMQKIPHFARRTFHHITERVDELVRYLRLPRSHELVDVLDAQGSPTGHQATVDQLFSKGLWFRGVHGVVLRSNGDVLMEQRSTSILTFPNFWELSFGGIVNAGESPDAAIQRELFEELGIRKEKASFEPILVSKQSHYLPRYGSHVRDFVHVFLVQIPDDARFKLQRSEVADARWFTLRKMRQLLKSAGSEHFHLMGGKAAVGRLLNAAEDRLNLTTNK
jgi:protein-tyrosine-phosphatase/isopentenyldiphosphate isomerase